MLPMPAFFPTVFVVLQAVVGQACVPKSTPRNDVSCQSCIITKVQLHVDETRLTALTNLVAAPLRDPHHLGRYWLLLEFFPWYPCDQGCKG